MNKVFFVLLVPALFLIACKESDTGNEISAQDLNATQSMQYELQQMALAVDSMMGTPHINEQHHWDSLYHHHDSIFWHHHNVYQHETYPHDDHHHVWVPQQHAPDYHNNHHYPGHPADSLGTGENDHHHDNSDNHHEGHDMHHHHVADSLHHLHNLHHP